MADRRILLPMTYIERGALVGFGLWLGIAVSRTQFEAAALPIYAIACALIIASRMAVVRYRKMRQA